jgi:hypothetical protein
VQIWVSVECAWSVCVYAFTLFTLLPGARLREADTESSTDGTSAWKPVVRTVATSKRGDYLSAQEPVQMTEATRKRGDDRRHMTEEHAANAAVVPFSTVEATPMRAFPSPEHSPQPSTV